MCVFHFQFTLKVEKMYFSFEYFFYLIGRTEFHMDNFITILVFYVYICCCTEPSPNSNNVWFVVFRQMTHGAATITGYILYLSSSWDHFLCST